MNNHLIDGVSEYHLFVRLHQWHNSPSAHIGAAFLPWHREFLTRFEKALRTHDPSVSLPYWDSALDHLLPEPKDSIIWSDDFMGDNEDTVNSGPFTNWSVPDECRSFLQRHVMENDQWSLISNYIIDTFNYTSFEEIVEGNVEYANNAPHGFVRGQMISSECSPADPMFWMHHAFIDRLWEDIRQNTQTTDLGTYYPYRSYWVRFGMDHNPNATMHPFGPLRNIDGIRVKYTRDDYNYAPRPMTCSKDSQCGPSLWCHAGRCQSKVRFNGRCAGFPINDTAPCELSRCMLSTNTYRCMEV